MAEQRTLNPQVLGSNPRGRTRSEHVSGRRLQRLSVAASDEGRQPPSRNAITTTQSPAITFVTGTTPSPTRVKVAPLKGWTPSSSSLSIAAPVVGLR